MKPTSPENGVRKRTEASRTELHATIADQPRRSPLDHAVLFVGSLAYLGFVPVASGTVAVAVVGVPLYLALRLWWRLDWPVYAALVTAFTLFSIWVAGRADRVLDEKDSKRNVIDELPGFLIAMFALPTTWPLVTTGFFLERALDIAKVWPASWIERRLPGGWGVVLDDVVAGLYTLAVLHVTVRLAPEFLLG